MQKVNYLQLKYEIQRGLIFQWNFQDLENNEKYFHHLLILMNNQCVQSLYFIQQYYKKIKSGDYFSIVYNSQTKGLQKTKWIQKTHLSPVNFKHIIEKMAKNTVSYATMENMFQYAAKLNSQTEFNILSNFIISKSRFKVIDLIKKIQHYRNQGYFKYICTIFAQIQAKQVNQISFSSGINILKMHQSSLHQTIHLYHNIINTAAIKYAKISIQLKDAQFLRFLQKNWKADDFNKISKEFYGPSVKYDEDVIKFITLQTDRMVQISMTISLQLHFFSEKIINSSKTLKLSIFRVIKHQMSHQASDFITINFVENVALNQNIFQTTTLIRIAKNIDLKFKGHHLQQSQKENLENQDIQSKQTQY